MFSHTFFCVPSQRRVEVKDLVKTAERGVSAPNCSEKRERKSNTSKLKATLGSLKGNGEVYLLVLYCVAVWCGVVCGVGYTSVVLHVQCRWFGWRGVVCVEARKLAMVSVVEFAGRLILMTASIVPFPESG